MARILVSLWCSLLLVSPILTDNTCTDSVDEVLEFINRAKSELKSTVNNPNITLVIGNTGSGKTFIVHYVAGDYSKMVSIDPGDDGNEYVVDDGLDTGNRTISCTESRTFLPEMVIDEAGNVWYDCPGFADTRSVKMELATSILIKTVIENASRVKIVLVVNYASVTKSYDRVDLDHLLTHTVQLVTHIDRYKNSVTLVVNKTPSMRIRGNKILDVQANSVKTSVANYLRDHRTVLQGREASEKKIQLINDLLKETPSGEYSRISISWRPNDAGPFNTIPKMVDARQEIRKSILGSISYTKLQRNDFGFPLTDTAQIYIEKMARRTISSISTTLTNIDRRVLSALQQRIQSVDSIDDKSETLAIGKRAIRQNDNNVTQLRQPIDEFTALNGALRLTSFKTELDLIKQHESNVRSLNLIAQTEIRIPVRDLIANASKTIEYLRSESDCYSFLKKVLEFLASYDVQKNVAIYNVANLADWGQLYRPQGLVIDASNFHQFTRIFLGDIEIQSTPAKLRELNAIIKLTLQSTLQLECKEELMMIKGNFVKSSDIDPSKWNKLCNRTSKITVFVAYAFFVDSDLNLDRYKELIILADEWIILRNSTFKMNGLNGKAQSKPRSSGTPGRPGNAGTNAGNFFGLARVLANGDSLTVNLTGGNGADGQVGTASPDTVATFTEKEHSAYTYVGDSKDYYVNFLEEKGYKVEHVSASYTSERYRTRFKFWFLIHPNCCGENGLGGQGGFGGLSGSYNFIDIGDDTKKSPKSVTNDGYLGKSGGNAKLCTSTMLVVRFEGAETYSIRSKIWGKFTVMAEKMDPSCPKRYVNSTVRISMPNPRVPVKFALPVIEYKTFLREQMANFRLTKTTRQTYDAIDLKANIDLGYTAMDFVIELNSLEKQFYKLKENVDFLPFYDQLLRRIESYAIASNCTISDRKILELLYTTALSKSVSMRSGQQSDLIIDIGNFFDLIIKNIKQLQGASRIRVIEQHRDKYNSDLKIKIDEAIDYVANDVQPEIKKSFSTLDMELKKVASEAIELQEQTQNEIKLKEENAEIIKRNMIIRGVAGVLNIIGKAVSFLGPVGLAVGILTQSSSAVTDAFLVDPGIRNEQKLPEGVKNVQNELGEIVKRRDQEKIDAVEKEMRKLYDTLNTMNAEKHSLNKLSSFMSEAETIKSRHPLEHKNIEQLCREFSDFIQKLQTSRRSADAEQRSRLLSVLKRAANTMAVIESSVDVYRNFVNDKTKLDAIGQAINADKSALAALKALEDHIYAELIPMVFGLQQTLDEAMKNLTSKSSVALNVQQWKIHDTLRSVERKLSKLISGFKNEYGVQNCLIKISEAFNLIINIYDRIQNYQDQSKLVNYLSDLQTVDFQNMGVHNPKLQELQFNLQANIILSLFHRAVGSFKQAIFPFAAKYLGIYKLPDCFGANKNVSAIAAAAESLSHRIMELNTTVINEDDKLIHTAYFGRNCNENSPFYVWPNNEVRDTIRDLFAGKKIYLLADVKRSSKLNAVKFNIIQIQLHSNNQTTNKQIQRILESFHVSLTHMGESNYRCNDQFYTISSRPHTIEQSFQQKNDRPIDTNLVYDKLRSGVKLLSPYTLWAIQLSRGQFDKLKPFVDSVDIELHGKGQYVNEGAAICNTDLEKYYSLMNVL